MKVSRAAGAGGAARVARTYNKRSRETPAAATTVAPVNAAVFGIPEAEFTPRVRDAVLRLMQEVDHLRREVQSARERLDDVSRAADQDTLLPILNRRAFVRELGRFIAFAERYGTPSSLIFFDLNDFKSVNDNYGHAAGDAVLRHFAETIARQVRESDVVGRLGGDEFGVLLAHVNPEQAADKAAKLAEQVRARPLVWGGNAIAVSFSYGVNELKPGISAEVAMERADLAMYAQKRRVRAAPVAAAASSNDVGK